MKKKYIIPMTDVVIVNAQNAVLETENVAINTSLKGAKFLGGNEGYFDSTEVGSSNFWDD